MRGTYWSWGEYGIRQNLESFTVLCLKFIKRMFRTLQPTPGHTRHIAAVYLLYHTVHTPHNTSHLPLPPVCYDLLQESEG